VIIPAAAARLRNVPPVSKLLARSRARWSRRQTRPAACADASRVVEIVCIIARPHSNETSSRNPEKNPPRLVLHRAVRPLGAIRLQASNIARVIKIDETVE
jgi:hypothetical protein